MNDAAASPTKFTIRADHLDAMGAGLTRLAKRAKKLGLEFPQVVVGPAYEAPVKKNGIDRKASTSTGVVPMCLWHDVTMEAATIVLAGWAVQASIEHLDEGNLVQRLPGGEVDSKYFDGAADCDHCKHDRRRKQTFILRHDDGRVAQVGTTCIADFTGHDATASIALAEMLSQGYELLRMTSDLDDDLPMCSVRIDPMLFLSYAAACVRCIGWVSRKDAIEGMRPATADTAFELAYASTAGAQISSRAPKIEEQDEKLAEAAFAWAQAISDADALRSDYLHNLRLVTKLVALPVKAAGVAASMLVAYNRELARAAQQRPNRFVSTANSTYQGEIGKREVFRLRLERVIETAGFYGPLFISIFQDAQGNSFKWFGSSHPTFGWVNGRDCALKIGGLYYMKATPKRHEEYKGTRQTTLARVTPIAKPKAKKAKAPRKARTPRTPKSTAATAPTV